MAHFTVRDPLAGDIDIEGDTLTDAIEKAYADVPPAEWPAYVWHDGEKIEVGGPCHPVQ